MADTYGFTKDYLTKNNQPWFPVMGEFHYSRYPDAYWKESVYKMKAGGVDIISTYVFWNHHEEIEGEYNFSGQRNLRKFTETVKECGMKMFLRIGPWAHGEVRNGGFPDWLLKKDFEPRTNQEAYFDEVRKFYTEIAHQVKGLLHKDGGPIIGIQIENEYGHCGGLKGEEGDCHMKRLTEIAKQVGLITPFYTATGWGGASTGGLLPVMGGYCEAPWEQSTEELGPNENYIFSSNRNDPNIGSDYDVMHDITYDVTAFPYLTAELGGGLQVTHHRRPVPSAKDIGAMSLTKLGSGVNLIGYYMYHGGTNPKGKLSTLQESKETGSPNDLPVFSYDFAAPVREYGQMTDTLNEIKLLAMFVKDFGSTLCKMDTVWENDQNPKNFEELRTIVRTNGKQGYLFVNNYQRKYDMKDHPQTLLQVVLPDEKISYPKHDIKNGDFFFFPFHMPIGDGELGDATATPLCRLHTQEEETYVFYADQIPEYHWERKPSNAHILTLSRDMALHAWKAGKHQDYLLISENPIIESDDGYEILVRDEKDILSYPPLPVIPDGYIHNGYTNEFARYQYHAVLPQATAHYYLESKNNEQKQYTVELEYPESLNDCFLQIDFEGDQAKLFIENEWVGDWFYTGETWEIGLKRFGFPSRLTIEISALHDSDLVFLEKRPVFKNGIACGIKEIKTSTEIHIPLIITE